MTVTEKFSKPEINFCVNNYAIHRADRTTSAKGGVAILVRKDIAHHRVNTPVLRVMEAVQIAVKTEDGNNIRLTAAYHPGSNKNYKDFSNDIAVMTRYQSSYVICGDFNAHHRFWNCCKTNSSGKILFDLMQKCSFSVHYPDSPTFYPSDSKRLPSTLDLILSNNLMISRLLKP